MKYYYGHVNGLLLGYSLGQTRGICRGIQGDGLDELF